MYTKRVTYFDLNNTEVTEEVAFNMNPKQRLDFVRRNPTFADEFQRVVVENDNEGMIDIVTTIAANSYGTIDLNPILGREYFKPATPEAISYFLDSEVFAEFVVELLSVEGMFEDFIKKVMPDGRWDDRMAKAQQSRARILEANPNATESDIMKAQIDDLMKNQVEEYKKEGN